MNRRIPRRESAGSLALATLGLLLIVAGVYLLLMVL
jgi:hypothetical protein